MQAQDRVFISYAREDREWAERLYMDLRRHELNAWIDVRCLTPGATWELEIKRALRGSRYVILIVSKSSINRRGFVQKEIKEAIDLLREFPRGQVFLIPVRLDATEPIDDELRALQWVNLLEDYHAGLERILGSLKDAHPAPLITASTEAAPTYPATVLDKGQEVSVEMPFLVGPRAPIRYAPFRSRKEFLQQFFDRLPSDSVFADLRLSYYVSLDTRPAEVRIGDDLKARFPESMTLVLQNAYRELKALADSVTVSVSFGGTWRTIGFPYESVIGVQVPEIGMTIAFHGDVAPFPA